jgi:Mg2+-importing ATPase
VTIPADNVDEDWLNRPRRWNLKFIKKFMYCFGPISSIFDFLTFFVLLCIANASESVFQTGWFMESLATQILVIHIIRTKKIPFLQSRASKYLMLSTIACVFAGWIIPFTFIGEFFKFQPLPWPVVLSITAIVLIYLFVVETVKKIFYKKYAKIF